MNRSIIVVGLTACLLILGASALPAATINPVGGDGANSSLQDVLNRITSPYPGTSSIDVNADQVAYDDYWSIGGGGGSVSTMIIQLAGNAPDTTFGVFSGSNYVPLFTGNVGAGTLSMLSIHDAGQVYVNNSYTGTDFAGNLFGYYIDSPGGRFTSVETLNSDGAQHMVAFQGTGDTIKIGNLSAGTWGSSEYILGFEDFPNTNWDHDYQDLVVAVESVHPAPVPEPGTMMLLGSGLIGLAGWGRKKFRK